MAYQATRLAVNSQPLLLPRLELDEENGLGQAIARLSVVACPALTVANVLADRGLFLVT